MGGDKIKEKYCLQYYSTLILFLFKFLHVLSSTPTPTPTPNSPPLVPALFIFGDSTVDTGNNNALVTLNKCNFPPYGRNFPGHISTGRCSDGKILSDYLAAGLVGKTLLPPFLGVDQLPQEEIVTGVSFGSYGSGYDPLTSETALVLSLQDQLNLFEEYKVKLRNMTGDERAKSIVSESLYIVSVGTDDIAITYFTTPLRLNYDVNSYVDLMVSSASSFLKKLYQGGARKIGVVGLPPVGCLPSQRTLGGGLLSRECSKPRNEAASLFNSKIKSKIGELERMLNGTRIAYLDIYNILTNFFQQPQVYGFKETTLGCCGSGLLETGVLCNSLSSICANDTTYLFWDSVHPTGRAYKLLTDALFNSSSIVELAKQSP